MQSLRYHHPSNIIPLNDNQYNILQNNKLRIMQNKNWSSKEKSLVVTYNDEKASKYHIQLKWKGIDITSPLLGKINWLIFCLEGQKNQNEQSNTIRLSLSLLIHLTLKFLCAYIIYMYIFKLFFFINSKIRDTTVKKRSINNINFKNFENNIKYY